MALAWHLSKSSRRMMFECLFCPAGSAPPCYPSTPTLGGPPFSDPKDGVGPAANIGIARPIPPHGIAKGGMPA